MAVTAIGPQSANFTYTRPATDAVTSTADTWFKPCTTGANDGTVIDASWLNVVVAQLRTAIKNAGITLDDTNDDMLWEAIQVAAEYVLPQATTNSLGGVKLATEPVALAGTDQTTAVTPYDLGQALAAAGCQCPPAAAYTEMTVQLGTSQTLDLTDLVSGGFTSMSVTFPGSLGTATISGSTLTYTAGATAGPDVVQWTATNAHGVSNTARIRVTVQAAAVGAPMVASNAYTITTDKSLAISLASLTNGAASSWNIGTPPAEAESYSLTGSVLTINAPPTAGNDSLTFTASGPGGTSNTGTINLTYAAPAVAAPTISGAGLNGVLGETVTLDLSKLTTGNVFAWALSTPPTDASAYVSGSILTVTMPAATQSSDTLQVVALGPGGSSSPATISLVWGSSGNPPLTDNGSVSIPQAELTVLDIAQYATPDATSFAIVEPSYTGAGLTYFLSGSELYLIAGVTPGAYTLEFTASNGQGVSNISTLSVIVT